MSANNAVFSGSVTAFRKILIVDASRVTRASLSKCLKANFEVYEDANGESAWQTLVLDSSIVAVISGARLARLDGVGLVERLRESRLSRLNGMPFFMVSSDSFSKADKQRAHESGVTAFIPKNLPGVEMAPLLCRLLEQTSADEDQHQEDIPSVDSVVPVINAIEISDDSGRWYSGEHSIIGEIDGAGTIGDLAGLLDDMSDDVVPSEEKTVVQDEHKIEKLLQKLLPVAGQGRPVGLLVFGLDDYESLVKCHGVELAERVVQNISDLMANKIRGEDSIGQVAPGRIAIIAPETNQILCANFANRICKALAAAQISVRGRRVNVTVSVGIAAMPEDGLAMIGQDFLMLALGRVDAAMRAGGNRVLSGGNFTGQEPISHAEFLIRLKELMSEAAPEALTPSLGSVGVQIMPILKQIEQSFHFGLPIDDMVRRLSVRARAERMSTTD